MLELRNKDLIEALAMALETMAFVTLEPPEGAVEPPDEPILLRSRYGGSRCGKVELLTSLMLGRRLVDNTLSCDSSATLILPPPQDPLVELLNITAGMLLKQQAKGVRFAMHVPEILPFDVKKQWKTFIQSDRCDVLLADGIVIAIRAIED
jgi:hypothetical protein